tara:strand:+ start:203 stop:646 length:444 start_codon:yes stop_codon:yes gene_type:complete
MDKKTLLILSGPNLNLLGQREPDVYGDSTLDEHLEVARLAAEKHSFVVEHFQSNHEGELVDSIQDARESCDAIIINPGAFGHYAWAIHDALASFEGPIVEVHLSNPAAREPWRHTSIVAPVAVGSIAGFGGEGYRMAVDVIARILEQ